MGGCYVKANASTTLANYIWYNGFLWRIMGINSNGSIKMITEKNVAATAYNSFNNIEFENSYADKW